MIKSILAKLESDDGYTFTNVMIPLTENLLGSLKNCKKLLQANQDNFSSVVLNGSLVGRISFPSEQFDATFKEDILELNTCKILRYVLKAIERTSVDLHVDLQNVIITAYDKEGIGYGHTKSVYLKLEDLVPDEKDT